MVSKEALVEIAVQADVAEEVLVRTSEGHFKVKGHNISDKQEKLARAAYEAGWKAATQEVRGLRNAHEDI